MDSLTWKDWAGIVGAITGTISLAMQVLPSRPLFYWQKYDGEMDERVDLAIVNTGNRAMMISGIFALPRGYGFFPKRYGDKFVDTVDDVTAKLNGHQVPVLCKPGETRIIKVNTIKEGSWAVILILWHRFWLLPIRIPKLLWLSHSMMKKIQHGGR